MKPFAKAIDAYYYVNRAEKNKKIFKFLYIGTNEVNVQNNISNDMENWDLDFDNELNFNNVHLTYKFKQSIIDEFLKSFPVQEYFYKNLKKEYKEALPYMTSEEFWREVYKSSGDKKWKK